jgi:hypothetical protein
MITKTMNKIVMLKVKPDNFRAMVALSKLRI